MIASTKHKSKKDVYCEHTQPRFFHALHFENSTETEESMEIYGHKITNKAALIALGLAADTVLLVLSIFHPIAQLFGRSLLEVENDVVENDYRCELCKKASK